MLQAELSARTRLKQKITDNYASFREEWLKLSPAELIDRCEELEAVTRMAQTLPSAVSEEDAEYLLRFKNPLDVVSDAWISRNGIDTLIVDDEMSHLLWSLRDRGDAEDDYETEDDDPEQKEIQAEKETNEMLLAEDAVQTTAYITNAPDCCSGAEQLDNMLGMLGADIMDEDVYHDEDEHPKMIM